MRTLLLLVCLVGCDDTPSTKSANDLSVQAAADLATADLSAVSSTKAHVTFKLTGVK
jgi:hypothetical protein